jgi:hypothetical protein
MRPSSTARVEAGDHESRSAARAPSAWPPARGVPSPIVMRDRGPAHSTVATASPAQSRRRRSSTSTGDLPGQPVVLGLAHLEVRARAALKVDPNHGSGLIALTLATEPEVRLLTAVTPLLEPGGVAKPAA